jgi:hypothetical protein
MELKSLLCYSYMLDYYGTHVRRNKTYVGLLDFLHKYINVVFPRIIFFIKTYVYIWHVPRRWFRRQVEVAGVDGEKRLPHPYFLLLMLDLVIDLSGNKSNNCCVSVHTRLLFIQMAKVTNCSIYKPEYFSME